MALVKLILREDVPSLGHAGDVVSVKPGFARNYLVPQGKAIRATEGRLAEIAHHKRQIEDQVARDRKVQESARDRIQGTVLEVEAQAGEEGRLFGSVTASQIAGLLAEKGIQVDRRRIELRAPIKEVGEHVVPIRLHRDVTAQVKVVVRPAGLPAASPAEPGAQRAEGERSPEAEPEDA